MFWNRLRQIERMMPVAERFRRQHERWLNRAIRQPDDYRRIPIRREDHGGFQALRSDPVRRAHAERWWRLVFDRLEDD